MTERDAETNAFVLSRIYGQGWTTAKKMLASSAGAVLTADASVHNPYRGQEERFRWEKGFREALQSHDQKIAATGRNAWPRGKKRSSSK